MSEDRCTCTRERDSDGAEMGMCPACEDAAYDDEHGNRDMLNELHANPQELGFDVCARDACRSEDIEVGPGDTARCNTCGVRW